VRAFTSGIVFRANASPSYSRRVSEILTYRSRLGRMMQEGSPVWRYFYVVSGSPAFHGQV
jgi:hypothetical protein